MENKLSGLAVPDELKQAFDKIHVGQLTLQFKSDIFSLSLQREAHELAITSKDVWDEAKAVMGLQGDWRYEDGMLYPITANV